MKSPGQPQESYFPESNEMQETKLNCHYFSSLSFLHRYMGGSCLVVMVAPHTRQGARLY